MSLLETETVYTTTQAAQQLGVHPRTVERWIAAGKLRAFRVGGWWRVRELDLETFVIWNDEREAEHGR